MGRAAEKNLEQLDLLLALDVLDNCLLWPCSWDRKGSIRCTLQNFSGYLAGSVCLIKAGSKLYRKIEHVWAILKKSHRFTTFRDTGFIV